MFACEAVDLDFLNTAPVRLSAAVKVRRPPSEIFAAFAHDPANCEIPGKTGFKFQAAKSRKS